MSRSASARRARAPSADIAPRRPDERTPSQVQPRSTSAAAESLQRTAGNEAVRAIAERAGPGATGSSGGATAVMRAALHGGERLDAGVRGTMEERLGRDLGDVRVHTGGAAADSARALGADAYTTGRDVVFGAGRYAPDTDAGQRLLAHELTHVAQQGERAPAQANGALVTDPAPSLERQAERIAGEVGGTTSVLTPPSTFSAPATGGGAVVQRAKSSVKAPPAKVGQTTPTPASPGPRVPPETAALIKADIETIVAFLRQQILWESEERQILALVQRWVNEDAKLGPEAGTPHVDQFIIAAKMRGYSRRTARSGFVADQWALVWDDLFFELEDERLAEFEAMVRGSKEFSRPSSSAQGENFWKTMGKKEAVGVWGILKGMGTSIAGMGDAAAWPIVRAMQLAGLDVKDPPSASAWLAKQYDIAGDEMFGKEEWSQGEELFLGLNAREFSTAGGEVIWQLVMMGRGGPQGGLEKAVGVLGNLKAIEDSAKNIAKIIEDMQAKSPNGTVSVSELLTNADFLAEVTRLVANIVGAVSNNRRIGTLLEAAQIAPLLGKLIELALADEPTEAKLKKLGPLLIEIVKQVVSTIAASQPGGEETAPGMEGAGGGRTPKGKKGAETPAPKSEKTETPPAEGRKQAEKVEDKLTPREQQPKNADELAKKMVEKAEKASRTPEEQIKAKRSHDDTPPGTAKKQSKKDKKESKQEKKKSASQKGAEKKKSRERKAAAKKSAVREAAGETKRQEPPATDTVVEAKRAKQAAEERAKQEEKKAQQQEEQRSASDETGKRTAPPEKSGQKATEDIPDPKKAVEEGAKQKEEPKTAKAEDEEAAKGSKPSRYGKHDFSDAQIERLREVASARGQELDAEAVQHVRELGDTPEAAVRAVEEILAREQQRRDAGEEPGPPLDLKSKKALERQAKITDSERMGALEGEAKAKADGIDITQPPHPDSYLGLYGKGIDAIGTVKGTDTHVIVEYKGGSSELSQNKRTRVTQMSDAWVGRKIAELKANGDPHADTLLAAARDGKLRGVGYRTALNESGQPQTEKFLDRKYDGKKVERAFDKRMKELSKKLAPAATPPVNTGAQKQTPAKQTASKKTAVKDPTAKPTPSKTSKKTDPSKTAKKKKKKKK